MIDVIRWCVWSGLPSICWRPMISSWCGWDVPSLFSVPSSSWWFPPPPLLVIAAWPWPVLFWVISFELRVGGPSGSWFPCTDRIVPSHRWDHCWCCFGVVLTCRGDGTFPSGGWWGCWWGDLFHWAWGSGRVSRGVDRVGYVWWAYSNESARTCLLCWPWASFSIWPFCPSSWTWVRRALPPFQWFSYSVLECHFWTSLLRSPTHCWYGLGCCCWGWEW